ncbi:MAG: hypothetical protein K8I60_11725 [Anaerolineae bacterium]|nr:hypothetical protein [Anaerolineae bacterium]
MTYKVKVTFAAGMTEEIVGTALAGIGISADSPPQGNLSHDVRTENGRLVYVDEWESKATFETFLAQVVRPLFEQAGIQPPGMREI